jgi:hypothetical protein
MLPIESAVRTVIGILPSSWVAFQFILVTVILFRR